MDKWVDYYTILELEFGCSDEDIKKNYRRLQKKYHPDSEMADEVKSREINEAYQVLGNPKLRKEYDETYFQYKNGDIKEDEDIPKYTYEEMHETFSEEEVYFAKRVALKKTIEETLENAKIIIDAKNELLFAAFNDEYNKDTYKEDYKSFLTTTNEYIKNLRDLVEDALEYALDEEISTINQVIMFLEELLEEIPKSLKEAKLNVKGELMREQLKNDVNSLIEDANKAREELVNLYRQTFHENLSKDEFLMYYNILQINVVDALSKLETIYDLLHKASLSSEYKLVGITIGKIKEDLKLYSGNYRIAKEIGKREDIKEQISKMLLDFDEYKVKMLYIMQNIINNPDLEYVKTQVLDGDALTRIFQNHLTEIDNFGYNESLFDDLIEDLHMKIMKVKKKRDKLDEDLKQVFANVGVTKYNLSRVPFLVEDIELKEEEIKVVDLLHKMYILLGESQEYMDIANSDDLKKLKKKIKKCLNKSRDLNGYLMEMLNYISEVVSNYESWNDNGQINLNKKIGENGKRYYAIASSLHSLANSTVVAGIIYLVFLTDLDTANKIQIINNLMIPDTVLKTAVAAASIFIPCNFLARILRNKAFDEATDRDELLDIYQEDEEIYKTMMMGNDPHLQQIFEKALKV